MKFLLFLKESVASLFKATIGIVIFIYVLMIFVREVMDYIINSSIEVD